MKTSQTIAIALLLGVATTAMASNGSMTEFWTKDHNAKWIGQISNLSQTGLDTYTGTWPCVDNSNNRNPRTVRITLTGASALTIDELESHQSYSGNYRKNSDGVIFFHAIDDGGVYEAEGRLDLN